MRKGYRQNTMLSSMARKAAKNSDRAFARANKSLNKSISSSASTSDDDQASTGAAVVIFLLFMLVGFIVASSHDNIFLGILYGLLIAAVGFVVAMIAAVAMRSTGNKEVDSKDSNQIELDEKYNETVETVSNLIKNQADLNEIDKILNEVDESNRKALLHKSMDLVLEETNKHLEDWKESGIKYIDDLFEIFDMQDYRNHSNKEYLSYVQNCTLYKLLNGEVPDNTLTGVNINWQPDEKFIWLFNNVVFYEEVEQTIRIGQSSGFSVKVAKGLYYRTGGFTSYPVTQSQLKAKSSGHLIITNKNVYFYSINKSGRYPYNKILAYVPFTDAIGIQMDRANAKNMYFQNIDGIFTYNLLLNVKNIQ